MLDLPPDQQALVQGLLKQYLPDRTVIAFGSRTNGKARKYSDLDLCVMEGNDWLKIAELKDVLENSPLPIRVDIVEWETLSPEFRRIIECQQTEII